MCQCYKNYFYFRFFSLLYGTQAPSSESQHPESWPASTYGHLRGVPDNKKLLSGRGSGTIRSYCLEPFRTITSSLRLSKIQKSQCHKKKNIHYILSLKTTDQQSGRHRQKNHICLTFSIKIIKNTKSHRKKNIDYILILKTTDQKSQANETYMYNIFN